VRRTISRARSHPTSLRGSLSDRLTPAEPSIETSESLDTPAVEAGLPAKGKGKQVVARTPSPAPPTDVHMQEAEPLSADAMSELAPVPPFRSAESLDDSDDYRSEDELPAKKKKTAKKALEKKVALRFCPADAGRSKVFRRILTLRASAPETGCQLARARDTEQRLLLPVPRRDYGRHC
jgi:hypothetical protein